MGLGVERKCGATIRGRRGCGGQECPPYMGLRVERKCGATILVAGDEAGQWPALHGPEA